ncbi:MAG: hypothetical protein [Bacteriophage sp.]|nr:MAG: hypothetical protein [Bacteriophage sp.]
MTKFNENGYAMLQNITPATDVIGKVVKYKKIDANYSEISSLQVDCGTKCANNYFLKPIDDAVYFFKAMDVLKLESMLIQYKDNFTHVSVEKENPIGVYFLHVGEVPVPEVPMSNDMYAIIAIDELINIIDSISCVKSVGKYFFENKTA